MLEKGRVSHMSHPCLKLKDVPKALRNAIMREYGEDLVKKSDTYALRGMVDEIISDAELAKTNALKMAEIQFNYSGPGGELDKIRARFMETDKAKKLQAKLSGADEATKEAIERKIQTDYAKFLKQDHMDFLSGSGSRLNAGKVSLDVLQDSYFSGYITAINKAMQPYLAGLPSRMRRNVPFLRKIDPKDIYHAMISPEKLDELAASPLSAKYARRFAEAAKPVLEKAFKDLVDEGFNAKYLQNWFMPQKYNTLAVQQATKGKWISDMEGMLDREKVIQAVTKGKRTKMSDKEWHKILKAIKDTIASEGTSKVDLKDVSPYARVALADTGAYHRYVHFKDSQARVAFEEAYGYMQPFQGIVNYLEQASKELALLKRLGPDPDATMRMRRNAIIQATGDKTAGKWIMDTYKQVTGQNINPSSNGVAGLMKNLTVLQVGSKLATSSLTALTDSAPTMVTAAMNDMSMSRTIMKYFTNMMNPLGAMKRIEFAQEMMITSRHAVDHASVLNRYADVTGVSRSTRLADTTLRVTGLNYVTEMGRATFGLEYLRNMSKMMADPKLFTKLSKRMQTRYGFTPQEMAQLIQTKRLNKKGVEYFDPRNVKDQDLQAKFVAAMREETNHAIPEAGAKTRAGITLGTKSNTILGEFMRGFGQFASFPTSMVLTHMSRANHLGFWKWPAYMGTLTVAGYGMGLIITQAKSVINGQDTRKLDHPNTHRDALIQGGTLGIIGDILLRDLSRQGVTLEAFAGPGLTSVFEAAENVIGRAHNLATLLGAVMMLTDKDVVDAFDEYVAKDRKLTRDAVKEFAPSTWQTRLIYEYLITDAFKAEMDPDYYEKKKRMATRRYNLYGQEY